jgi:protein-S-isoprenylcysteine O-methyltransferase Ste14
MQLNAETKENQRAWKLTKAELAISIIGGIMFIVEILACFFFYYNACSLDLLLYIGWALLILGFVMMALPRMALSRGGGIPEGKSWVHTTVIVDKGIYGVVRHPLYVGWMLSIIGMTLISQHWVTLLLGIIPLLMVIHYTRYEDKSNVEKFGESYTFYSERVPMMNFVVGLARYLKQRGSS